MKPDVGAMVEVLTLDGTWRRATVMPGGNSDYVVVQYKNMGMAAAGLNKIRLIDKTQEERETLEAAIVRRKQQGRWQES